ncbi:MULTISPECIES: SOS response-associated peptidase family protein [unclassified Brevundimonas]|uniref:SOS response-associated peptidase family protein n=1 Tax=unclassified Brevundimonas TaxID=2622653 RepID=UPI0025C568CC|nr:MULTISPECIES: SOS response-associated peptidase family protein [unclassified Brevundimonas]
MCNLYAQKAGPAAIMKAAQAARNAAGNLEPGDIYPDYAAPIVRMEGDERILTTARWGMPSSRKAILDAATKRADKLRARGKEVDFDELLKMEPDGGTTNVRNTSSQHWKRWLTPEHRCLVPFTAFSEPGRTADGKYRPVWFKLSQDEADPLAFFAGIHLQGWEGVRKIKTGWETADLYAFLTTDPSEPVKSVHPKAMPVILTEPDDIEMWMNGPWDLAKVLQRPLPNDALVEILV